MCLGLDGHPRGVCQPLIAPEPLVGHGPGQRYPHDDMLIDGAQFDI